MTNKPCKCGRTSLHCPHCGCGTCYAVARLTRVVDDTTIYSYRCRKCGRIFDDLALELCSAPHKSERYTQRIVAKLDKAVEGMTHEQRKQHAFDIIRGRARAASIADEIDKKE